MMSASMCGWAHEMEMVWGVSKPSITESTTNDNPPLENSWTNDESKEKGNKGRTLPLIPKFKQKQKITQMLSSYEGYDGLFLDSNSRGFIRCSREISVSSKMNGFCQDLLIRDKFSEAGNFCNYFLSTKNKKLRIKNWSVLFSKKNGNKKRNRNPRRIKKARAKRNKRKKEESVGLNRAENYPNKNYEAPGGLNHSSNDCDNSVEDDAESEEEKEEDCNDYEERNLYCKVNKFPRKMSYLFRDSYIIPRHSKRSMEERRNYLSDFSFCPSRRQKRRGSATLTTFNETIDPKFPQDLTLGNFLPAEYLARLEPQQSAGDPIFKDSFISTGIKEAYNSKREQNIIPSMNQIPSSHLTDSDIVVMNDNEGNESEKHLNQSDDKNVFIILPHCSLKVDNLISEFKENYREIVCKKRRFILNVSHLAIQYLIHLNVHPCDLISQLDIKMYLIFVYIQKFSDENDKYRLWINSSIQVVNDREVFNEVKEEKVTSIHEIIQTAMEALNDLQLDSAVKYQGDLIKENTAKYPVCSFRLLKSVILRKRLLDHSDNSQQTRSPNLPQPSTFSSRMSSYDSLSSSSIARKGPSESSMCGICLRNFDTKSVFPFALLACCHWFCEECWISKLKSQMKEQNNKSVFCIERHCDKTIDTLTLVSIMDLKTMNISNNRRIDVFQDTPTTISCLNLSCQKELQMEIGMEMHRPVEFIPITCSCSWQYCPQCIENPHWPAECDISTIYHKCIEAQGLDTFNRLLTNDELPDLLLRGKCCPKCGIFIQEKTIQIKIEHCLCGCSFCWQCGKEIDVDQNYNHSLCVERFELSDKKLKDKMITHLPIDSLKDQSGRWFKVALNHRRMRHPQVIKSLYTMAEQISDKAMQVFESGKHIGDVKSAATGWKPVLQRWNNKRLRSLNKINHTNTKQYSLDSCEDMSLVRSRSSSGLSDSGSSLSEKKNKNVLLSPSRTMGKEMVSKSLIQKAMCNIVQTKLELHHIVEYIAVMLEFDHALKVSQNTGKVIRNLERAEDLCEALGLILQEHHNGDSSRVIPSFFRLRLQANNMLSSLYHHLNSY